MNQDIIDIYIHMLVKKKRPLVWRSKSSHSCFKIRFDGTRKPIFLRPDSVSLGFCIKIWDWELYPKRTLYI